MEQIDISARLRQLRGEKTLEEFAQELGTNHPNIYRYEHGRMPSAEFLLLLLKKGINLNWVLSGEGPIHLPEQEKASRDNSQEADMVMVGGFMLPGEMVRQIERGRSNWVDLLLETMKLHSESPPARRRVLEILLSSVLQVFAQLEESQKAERKVAG